MHLVEADIAHQLDGALELLLGLAAETHDNVGAQRHAGNPVTDLVYQPAILVVGVAAPHGGQHLVVARLEGQVHVLAHFTEPRHRVDDVVAHVRRVRGQEAYPLDAVDFVRRLQQIAQVPVARQVVAVRVHVLPQQCDLFHAPLGQQPCLAHHVLYSAAHLSAAAIGDDAEGAELVAAVDDGDIGGHVGPRRERAHAAFGIDAHALAQQIEQGPVLLRAHEHVHVRKSPLQRVGLRPHHAAHERDNLVGVAALLRLETGDHADHLVLRALAHDAAVEHHHVGIFGGAGGRKTHLAQRAL